MGIMYIAGSNFVLKILKICLFTTSMVYYYTFVVTSFVHLSIHIGVDFYMLQVSAVYKS